MSQEPEPLIDAVEVGRRLGMKPDLVLRQARRGAFPAVRISAKVVRFNWSEVWKVIEARSQMQGETQR